MITSWVRTLVATCLAASAPFVQAERDHRWVSARPGIVKPAQAYFTNLSSGDKIETPYLVKFGLSRLGLAGIERAVPHAGHHHLLINQDLPLNFTTPLPFTDKYVHFGKGQMEAVIDLPPGQYALRLLLADDKHLPTFAYSPAVQVTVTARRAGIDANALVKRGVALLSPSEGQSLQPPFLVRFHASGLNVGHIDVKAHDAGHFRLVAQLANGKVERLDWPGGQTEAWIDPPAGAIKLHAELVSNADTSKVIAKSTPIGVTVLAR